MQHQRGTVRHRSPSDTDSCDRPSQRPRRQTTSHSRSSKVTRITHSPEDTQRTMGAPVPSNTTGNGVTDAESSSHGPYELPARVLDRVRLFQPPGSLMYEDDQDWVDSREDDIMLDINAQAPQGGDTVRRKQLGKRMPIDREEVVRLMLQGLQDMGYQQAAAVLARESGLSESTQAARDFEAAILGGRWTEATALLPELGLEPSSSSPIVSSSSSIASGKIKATGQENEIDRATFLIAQQKYLEFLESGQQKKALSVLRNELATSATDSDALHDLSGFMMCLDRDDLYERAKWDGAAGISRRQLLERLQESISPLVMVPSRRLGTLLDQARQYQQQTCLYHDDKEPISLYIDHQCESGAFPSISTHVLADHKDEVWRLEWSPNGNLLASTSKDRLVVIWQLLPPSKFNGKQYSIAPLHHLTGHGGPVDALAWSPDGETLVTCSDKQVIIWNAKTGERSPVTVDPSPHTDTISSCQWMPDGSKFVVASMDFHLVFYDTLGNIVHKWAIPNLQICDFAITPDGTRIVAATRWVRRVSVENRLKPSISSRDTTSAPQSEFAYGKMDNGVAVIRIADRDIIDYVTDNKSSDCTSLTLSHDGTRVLVSCAPDELQLFALEPHLHVLRKFVGHVQSRFLIRSTFGAPKDRFILSGSEDGHVYVWQSNGTTPIEVLSGHKDTVNAVAWNPVLSRKLFASCSDDATIRIWQPPLHDPQESVEDGMEL